MLWARQTTRKLLYSLEGIGIMEDLALNSTWQWLLSQPELWTATEWTAVDRLLWLFASWPFWVSVAVSVTLMWLIVSGRIKP